MIERDTLVIVQVLDLARDELGFVVLVAGAVEIESFTLGALGDQFFRLSQLIVLNHC